MSRSITHLVLALSVLATACAATAPAPVTHYAVQPEASTDSSEAVATLAMHAARPDTEDATPRERAWDKYSVSLGYMSAALDTDARFGLAGAGVQVNLEDLLGFQTGTSSVRIDGSWRFSENRRHRIDLGYVDFGRTGSLNLKQDVDVGPVTLPAGTGVRSDFDIQLLRTEYNYSFFQDERVDLAAGFGLYVAPIDFSMTASGLATYSDSFDVTAPLPLVGLRMDFAVTPQWYLRSKFSLLYLEVGEYVGEISDINASVEYRPWEHVAFGLGIDSFGLGVEQNGSTSVPGVNARGAVDFEYVGLMLYLKGLW